MKSAKFVDSVKLKMPERTRFCGPLYKLSRGFCRADAVSEVESVDTET
jgi:hypothetical protein